MAHTHTHPAAPPQDEELLRFVDLECFLWSTVNADLTPLINAGMVFCDRHYGGINYPVGGWALACQLADKQGRLLRGWPHCGGINCPVRGAAWAQ